MTTETVRRRFELILEALPSDVPTAVRLRTALKRLLRNHGLRCVSASELTHRPAPGRKTLRQNCEDAFKRR